MKKLINTSFVYFILAMIAGVFYREFTKFYNFTEKTTLSVVSIVIPPLFEYFIIFWRILQVIYRLFFNFGMS